MSERKYEERSFYQVTWEWEDAIYKAYKDLNIEVDFDYVHATKNKILQYLFKFIIPKKQLSIKKTDLDNIELYFPLRVWHCNQYLRKNMIPIFLDVYECDTDVIIKMTKKLPFYFVTAFATYELIKKKAPDSKVFFMPLSISDRWISKDVPSKDIDVIQMGRRSSTLHEYMLQYCQIYPNVNYVYLESKKTWHYISTIHGDMGTLDTRGDYMNMLKRAKVSLVSTPGIETHRFGEFDFFTPRFYESAACYCLMIGRYTENEEAKRIEIKSVCPNIRNYNEFEYYISCYLHEGLSDFNKYLLYQFSKKNATSQRAMQILRCLERR